jgi:hypothetical protein
LKNSRTIERIDIFKEKRTPGVDFVLTSRGKGVVIKEQFEKGEIISIEMNIR